MTFVLQQGYQDNNGGLCYCSFMPIRSLLFRAWRIINSMCKCFNGKAIYIYLYCNCASTKGSHLI